MCALLLIVPRLSARIDRLSAHCPRPLLFHVERPAHLERLTPPPAPRDSYERERATNKKGPTNGGRGPSEAGPSIAGRGAAIRTIRPFRPHNTPILLLI